MSKTSATSHRLTHVALPSRSSLPSKVVRARRLALEALNETLADALAPGTVEKYDGNLGRFLEFALSIGIPTEEALPCSDDLLCLFLASRRGHVGKGTAKNYISSIRSWHVKRNLPWLPSERVGLILKAIHSYRPLKSAKKKLRMPVTPSMLSLLVRAWGNGSRKELAALAGALSCWFGMMRLGEFFPRTPSKVDCARLPARFEWVPSKVSLNRSSINLPWTKTTQFDGATVQLTDLNLPFNASSSMRRHLQSSQLNPDDLLSQYRDDNGQKRSLDKLEFIRMCRRVWEPAGIKDVSGHSFRIGGTDTLLKAGVSTDIVKSMGRWKSDAFLVYWRDFESIFSRATRDIPFNINNPK